MTWNTRRFCIALHCRSLSGIIPFLLMYSGEYTSFTSKEANSAAQSRYSELFWPPTRIIFESEETWKYYSSWAVDCDTYECFCRLQSNVFDAASLFQTNHVVHWTAPREDIFFCVASWLFRITWCSFTTCLSSRGKLTALFIVSNASKKPLWICPDHVLSSADKQRPRWQFYGRQKAR